MRVSGEAMAMGDYGDGGVYQRGARWWISYHNRGKRFREPGGKTEAEAKKKLKARLREIYGDRFIGPIEERVTVDELLDDLMTHLQTQGAASIGTVRSHLRPVREFFSLTRAAEVTTSMVERYIQQQQTATDEAGEAAPKANATINRQTGALRQAFNLAARRKPPKLSRVPYIPTLPEDNARQGFVEPATFEAIVAHLPAHLADLARFAYATGWRKGHVTRLRWDLVNRETREVRSPSTAKNKRAPSLPLTGKIWDVIERRWAARRYQKRKGVTALAAYVFHGGNGKAVVDFKRSWAAACEKAGTPGTLFHDLRRSAVRNMIRGGVSQAVAMRVSGHKTAAMFNRYDITTDADKADALAKAEAYVDEQAKRAPKSAAHGGGE